MRALASLRLWNWPFEAQIKKSGVWIGLFALMMVLTFMTDGGFLSPRNLTNLMRQTAVNGTLAAGMTLVILIGGIDLSIGSVVALVGILIGLTQVAWGGSVMATMASFGVACLAGTAIGFFNGSLIAWLRIPPFVITLGMMVIARGVALILSDGTGISPMGGGVQWVGEEYFSLGVSALFIGMIGVGLIQRLKKDWSFWIFPTSLFALIAYAFLSYKGFPVSILFLVASLGAAALLLSQTVLGRSIFAVGSNEQAAHWAGIPVTKVKAIVYGLMGFFTGVGAFLLTARLNSAVPTAGQLFELDAIAAVVIGGTSLKGGRGSILGAFAGAMMIAVLNNGMDLLLVPSFYQMVFKGLIIIVAVAMDTNQRATT